MLSLIDILIAIHDAIARQKRSGKSVGYPTG